MSGHPGTDEISVIYPALEALPPEDVDFLDWCEVHRPEIKTETVTRDEFMRRMAGCPDVLRLLGEDVFVVSLLDPAALRHWKEATS